MASANFEGQAVPALEQVLGEGGLDGPTTFEETCQYVGGLKMESTSVPTIVHKPNGRLGISNLPFQPWNEGGTSLKHVA